MKRLAFLLLPALLAFAVTGYLTKTAPTQPAPATNSVSENSPTSSTLSQTPEMAPPAATSVAPSQNQNNPASLTSTATNSSADPASLSDGNGTPLPYSTRLPENAVLASQSQDAEPGTVIVPDSSLEKPGDAGVVSHTNHLFIKPDPTKNHLSSGSFVPGGESPQSLRAIYNLPSTGGSGIIAIVDAFDYPTALKDFNVFAKQFGLPVETSTNATASSNTVFQVVYGSGRKPLVDTGWAQECALDIEWAHAMAPNAKIVLVEANSDSDADLNQAVTVASKLIGIKQVSMSWGSTEYRSELTEDPVYTGTGVVYFAAAGDVGGVVNYPGTSPNVVSAGGTSVNRNSSGTFVSETAWSGGGGGKSRFEIRPAFQTAISSLVGNSRGTPDLSFDANPYTGVAVYDSTPYYGYSGWMIFGGTSVSSPSLAGIVNLANSGQPSSNAELTRIYSNLGTSNFRDITSGRAGSFSAKTGWDFVTGVGSCLGLQGK